MRFRVSRMGTYRDFGFFVDLARALAVLVRAEDLQGLLARSVRQDAKLPMTRGREKDASRSSLLNREPC